MNKLIEDFFNIFFLPNISKILSEIINFSVILSGIIYIFKFILNLYLKRKNNLNLTPYYTNTTLKSAKKNTSVLNVKILIHQMKLSLIIISHLQLEKIY